MPILNYICSDCGNKFSKIFVDEQNAPKVCPVCDSGRITEQGSAFSADVTAFARLSCESCGTCESCETSHDNRCDGA